MRWELQHGKIKLTTERCLCMQNTTRLHVLLSVRCGFIKCMQQLDIHAIPRTLEMLGNRVPSRIPQAV
ncbi:hypothetical protein BKM88_04530 [Anaplasma marginale]|nr:hypothetical protein CQZ76_04540 [Anaplasma marginale]AXW85322.1 hypothetical protein BKM88_04530 [Anaplasma marginale]